MNKPDLSGCIARWILLLQEFIYEVTVKSGKANANTDFLSRQRRITASNSIFVDFPDEFPEKWILDSIFRINTTEDFEFKDVIQYLVEWKYSEGLTQEEKSVFQDKVAPYSLIQEILFKMGADEVLQKCLEKKDWKRVMTTLHSELSGGHFAAITGVNWIRSAGYWWPHLIQDVKAHVRGCDQCQRTSAPSFQNHWPLTPIIPLAPFEKWGIDFIGPINPASAQKKKYIILATDYATKWVEARSTRKNDALAAASFLFEDILMRFSYPLELVSN